jgi:hypothetical protein
MMMMMYDVLCDVDKFMLYVMNECVYSNCCSVLCMA